MSIFLTIIALNIFSTCSKMVLDSKTLSIEKKPLHVPPLQEIANVLNEALKSNFQEVQVEVVDCPDLTQQPFTLVTKGLQGSPRLIEVGGPPYLVPLVQRDKVYDLKDIAKLADLNSATLIGAGAGPFPYAGVNCEGMMNLKIENGKVDQQTRIAKVDIKDGSAIQEQVPYNETRFALLANLFACEGNPGQVLKVHAKKRIGPDDFIKSMQRSLANHYGNKIVGLGGTFLLKEGKAKQHVMPDFSETPLHNDEDVYQWLNFYNMSAPLIAIGTFVTGEYDLDLRLQHFHSFSHHGEGGHYHIDTTPDTVEYLGYFNTGEYIYRIDKPDPEKSHKFGRD